MIEKFLIDTEKINIKYDKELDKNIKNCYSFLENKNTNELFKKIFLKIKNIEKILKKKDISFFTDILNLIGLNKITYNNDIKNEKELFLAYISIFIVDSLAISIKFKESLYEEEESYNIQDSDDILNKISLNIKKIVLWWGIKVNVSVKYDTVKMREIVYKILIHLIDLDIIKSKKIDNFIQKKSKKIIFSKENIIKKNTEIYYNNFNLYVKNENYFIYTNHYSTIQEIFKENIFSSKTFKINNDEVIKKLINNWVFIDKIFLKKIYEIYLNDIKVKCEDLEKRYDNLINNLKDMINEKNINGISESSKIISKFENCIRIKNILKNVETDHEKIYLPFLFDFRGRIYYTSWISPTFYSEFRYVIHKGYYEKDELIQNNNEFSNEIRKYFHYIKDIKTIKTNEINEVSKEAIIWILISIAEIFKNSIGKEAHIKQFIEKGIEILNNMEWYIKNGKIKDNIKILQGFTIIKEISENIFIKRLISKDATASVFQHLILSLGWKNENALKLCNLKSIDTWYDTYQFIIDDFKIKNKNNLTKEKFNECFNRKTLKKIIMTENYSAGFKTCKNYFIKELSNININEIEKIEVEKIFTEFYKHIHSNNFLLENEPDEIINFFEEEKNKERVIIYNDGSIVDFKYFNFKEKEMDFYINNKRYTKKYRILTTEFNKKKFKISIKANYVQSLDAALVRWIVNKEIIITIHDCFLIDYINISNLIMTINIGMNENMHKIKKNSTNIKISSIFIVL